MHGSTTQPQQVTQPEAQQEDSITWFSPVDSIQDQEGQSLGKVERLSLSYARGAES